MELIVLVLHHHLSLKNFHRCLTFLIILTVVSFFPLSFLRLFFYWLAGLHRFFFVIVLVRTVPTPALVLWVGGGGDNDDSSFSCPLPHLSCGGPICSLSCPLPRMSCGGGGGEACSILLSSLVVLIQLLLRW